MRSSERRLGKLEAGLSPKEAVLAWLAEAHAHGSLPAYVASLRGAPEAAYPLVRLARQAETAARGALRGRPGQEVARAVRVAVRDAAFLYYLAGQLNWRALERRRANWLHLALVAEMLGTALERETPRALAAGLEQAGAAAHTACVQQGIVQAVAERYFDGLCPLFPDLAADVAEQAGQLGRAISIFNELLGVLAPPRRRVKRARRAEPFPEPPDLARLQSEAEAAIRAELAILVDLAKAEALSLLGEREQGYALVGRHIWGAGG